MTILDRSIPKLRQLDVEFAGKANCVYSTKEAIERYSAEADLVIGAVLVPGANAPKLITREIIKSMKPGSVVVDVAIDQGGCLETSKATTHEEPTFVVDDVVHYCVANMPGAVPQTSTYALNNATLPFTLSSSGKGPRPKIRSGSKIRFSTVRIMEICADVLVSPKDRKVLEQTCVSIKNTTAMVQLSM